MILSRAILIEDSSSKGMEIYCELKREGIQHIFWATNAEKGIHEIEQAIADKQPYDVLVSDMHFDFYGNDDREAGEKTMNVLRQKGIDLPVIFCSSQNWRINGAAGSVFYNSNRDWEEDLRRELKKLKGGC